MLTRKTSLRNSKVWLFIRGSSKKQPLVVREASQRCWLVRGLLLANVEEVLEFKLIENIMSILRKSIFVLKSSHISVLQCSLQLLNLLQYIKTSTNMHFTEDNHEYLLTF